jgi:hypothetical protein
MDGCAETKMLKGAKTWEEMRAELPLDVQQRLDERAAAKAKARRMKPQVATEARKGEKPAA